MNVTEELDKLLEEHNARNHEFDENFRKFHEQELKKASELGEKDGINGIPNKNTDGLTVTEQEIISSYKAKVEEVNNIGREFLNKLHHQYLVKMDEDLDNFDPSMIDLELKELQEKEKEKLEDLKLELGEKIQLVEKNSDLKHAEGELGEVRRHYNIIKGKEKRIITDGIIPNWAYWILFFIFAFGEAFLNYFVFELFGESKALTWVFTLSFGFVYALAGHFTGIMLKQYKLKNIWSILSTIIIISIVLALAYFMGSFREYFIVEYGVMPQFLGDVTFKFFVSFVFLIFIASAISSYFHADSNPKFMKIQAKYKKCLKDYNSEIHVRDEEIKKLNDLYSAKVKEVKEKIDKREYNIKEKESTLRGLLNRTISHFNTILHAVQSDEKLINHSLMETILTYRCSVNQVSPESPVPHEWKNEVEIDKPICSVEVKTKQNYKNDINFS